MPPMPAADVERTGLPDELPLSVADGERRLRGANDRFPRRRRAAERSRVSSHVQHERWSIYVFGRAAAAERLDSASARALGHKFGESKGRSPHRVRRPPLYRPGRIDARAARKTDDEAASGERRGRKGRSGPVGRDAGTHRVIL